MSVTKLQEVIDATPVKRITHAIKANPDLVEFLQSFHGDSLPEKAYNAINGDSYLCKRGNHKKFTSYTKGYRMCGHAGVCQCKHEIVSGDGGSVSKAMRSRTREQIEEANRKRDATFEKTYGVTNAGQLKNINRDES